MIVSGHQPAYLPWLGYVEKILKSDTFIIHDLAKFDNRDFVNRNKIKTSQGELWLTVPVRRNLKSIVTKDIKIDNDQNWKSQHFKSIKMNYSKAPYFEKYIDFFEGYYKCNYTYLVDLNNTFLEFLIKELEINTEIKFASENTDIKGVNSDFVLSMCRKFKADEYYSGSQGVNYVKEEDFIDHNIKIVYQKYIHPSYTQLFGQFIPNLSVIDLLLNHGPNAKNIILGDV